MLSILTDTVAGQAILTVGTATLAFLLLLALDTRAARARARREARWERAQAQAAAKRESMLRHPAGRTARYAGTRQLWTREH